MGLRTWIFLCSITLICAGCDFRVMDPRWHSLQNKGISIVPGEYESAHYIHGVTDEEFASAVPDLRRVGVKELHLQNTQLTDPSTDGILKLTKLERLNLFWSDFTVDGLVRLAALPRLKRMYVPDGQFSDEELKRLREALPNARVEESILGSYRFRTEKPGVDMRASRGSHNPPMQRTATAQAAVE